MKNRVGCVAMFPWAGISSPLLNTIKYFSDKGYLIEIFTLEKSYPDVSYFKDASKSNKIIIHRKQANSFFKIILPFWAIIIRVFRKIYALFVSSEKKQKKKLFRRSHKDIANYTLANLSFWFENIFSYRRFDFVISFDTKSLLSTKIITRRGKCDYYFFSLEIPEKKHITNEELKIASKAKLSFSQDEIRVKIVADNFSIPSKKIKILYNSSHGKIVKNKSDFFRNKFKISNKKKIVLLTGSIREEHMFSFFVNSISSWSDKYVLVIHTWTIGEKNMKLIEKYKEKHPNRIFVSFDTFTFSKKSILFSAVDYGLIGFSDIDINMKYAIGSSGKLFDFWQCGVPVIVFKSYGAKEWIEDNNGGIIVEKENEVYNALEKIEKKYQSYREKIFELFPKFEFSKTMNLFFN